MIRSPSSVENFQNDVASISDRRFFLACLPSRNVDLWKYGQWPSYTERKEDLMMKTVKDNFFSAIQWGLILGILVFLFILLGGGGFRSLYEALLVFIAIIATSVGFLSLFFVPLSFLEKTQIASPLRILVAKRENERRADTNRRNIQSRIASIKERLPQITESGTVVSAEAISITNVSGAIRGGGGSVYTSINGFVSGSTREVYGNISSSTTIVNRFFVSVADLEYVFTLDSDAFSVRTGSDISIVWISRPESDSFTACKLVNNQTRKTYYFEDSVENLVKPLLAELQENDPDFTGVSDIVFFRELHKSLRE